MAAAWSSGETRVLGDLLVDLRERVGRLLADAGPHELHARPYSGGNNIAVTIWHLSRWLDVTANRVIGGEPADQESWIRSGWAHATGYDPRGLGEGALGVLTGYTTDEVDAIPALDARTLETYHREAVDDLLSRLAGLGPADIMAAPRGAGLVATRAAAQGLEPATYAWVKMILEGCFGHLGESQSFLIMRRALPG